MRKTCLAKSPCSKSSPMAKRLGREWCDGTWTCSASLGTEGVRGDHPDPHGKIAHGRLIERRRSLVAVRVEVDQMRSRPRGRSTSDGGRTGPCFGFSVHLGIRERLNVFKMLEIVLLFF